MAASRAAQMMDVPVVWEPMGMARAVGKSTAKKWLMDNLIGRKTLGRANRIIATADIEQQDQLAAGIPAEKIRLRPNGVEPVPEWLQVQDPVQWKASARSQLTQKDDWQRDPSKLQLLYLGRISDRKGLAWLSEALTPLANTTDCPFELTVVGPVEPDGTLESMQKNLGTSLHQIGPVDSQEKWLWFAACDLFVLPSLYGENFAISALEANCAGTPVLLSSQVGYGGYIDEQTAHAGLGAVLPLDQTLWRDSISAAEPATLALAEVQALRQRFSWPQIVGQQIELYQQVLQYK